MSEEKTVAHLASRKADHLQLALDSQTKASTLDQRFYYEPLFGTHPNLNTIDWNLSFLGKKLRFPLWVSSMTGGTQKAKTINHNLARLVGELKLGMGLGSCRPLLENKSAFADFDVREVMGNDQPLYANLGVAQVQELIEAKALGKIEDMVGTLRADGLIVHVNPLQEFFQDNGDHFFVSPLETIQTLVAHTKLKIIVKEVGHGMGPQSLLALMKLPLAAIEFSAFGGTNFSLLEKKRASLSAQGKDDQLVMVGHSAVEMVGFVQNHLHSSSGLQCKEFIISGGVNSMLDAWALIQGLPNQSIFGQAANLLTLAQGDYKDLKAFVEKEMVHLEMCRQYLKVKEDWRA